MEDVSGAAGTAVWQALLAIRTMTTPCEGTSAGGFDQPSSAPSLATRTACLPDPSSGITARHWMRPSMGALSQFGVEIASVF